MPRVYTSTICCVTCNKELITRDLLSFVANSCGIYGSFVLTVIHCSSIRMICDVRQMTPDTPCPAYPLRHGFVMALQIGSAFSKCLDTIFHRCEIVQTSPVFCGCSVLNHLTPNEITVCMVSGVLP